MPKWFTPVCLILAGLLGGVARAFPEWAHMLDTMAAALATLPVRLPAPKDGAK